ncbi:MAG: hypothetical protein Q7T05_08635 [Dehalococcoidia bacterium]|nr:hypothetical protein [Dehalococcoidia bacterium]
MSIAKARNSGTVKWARLMSNIFHPWIVLVPVLGLAAYQALGEPLDSLRWTVIAFLPALVVPFIYGKIRVMVLSRGGERRRVSRSLVRNDPRQLLIMTGLFGIPAALTLHFLDGPRNLLVIILGVAAVMLAIAMINLTFRASFHLSMVTSMLTALWFLFGAVSLVSFMLIPVLGVSRYRLGEHTPIQMVVGIIVGLVVGGAVFFGLGLAE